MGLDVQNLWWAGDEKQALEAELARFDSMPDSVDLGVMLATQNSDDISPRTRLELVRRMRQLPAPASSDIRLDDAEAFALSLGTPGDTGRAEELLRRKAELARSIGARFEQIHSLNRLAEILWIMEGKPGEAVAPAREAVALRGRTGDDEWPGKMMLSNVLYLVGGSSSEVFEIYDELLAFNRGVGHRRALLEHPRPFGKPSPRAREARSRAKLAGAGPARGEGPR